MKIDYDLSSTELQMKNYLESIFEGKEFLGAKIEDSLNIFKIAEKMFENTSEKNFQFEKINKNDKKNFDKKLVYIKLFYIKSVFPFGLKKNSLNTFF